MSLAIPKTRPLHLSAARRGWRSDRTHQGLPTESAGSECHRRDVRAGTAGSFADLIGVRAASLLIYVVGVGTGILSGRDWLTVANDDHGAPVRTGPCQVHTLKALDLASDRRERDALWRRRALGRDCQIIHEQAVLLHVAPRPVRILHAHVNGSAHVSRKHV